MALESGTRLGTYEVRELLGKGGMGEVYRARDTKLGRDVAIKVLPSEFAQDADRLARFEREARLLASLSHPNIAAIHGLEEHEGSRFLVLEVVEGDTLDDRLDRGPIPVEESLRIALQIADALQAAHDRGVVHRDLKPANIKLSADGRVKVLDFGLAKAFEGDAAEVNLSNSPTLSLAATQQGIILGTAAYMSPEQARGLPVDKRADIWALGCVLFEMLTGRQVFAGPDVSTILARVLDRDPDFTTLPPDLNPKLGDLLERCLQKDVRRRYHDVGDIRLDLEEALADPTGRAVPAGVESSGARSGSRLAWIAAVVLAAALAGLGVWGLTPSAPRPIVRFSAPLAQGQSFTRPELPVVDVSPDGSRMAYVTDGQIWLRELSEPAPRPVPGTQEGGFGPAMPVFSPDGQWLAYVQVIGPAQTVLKRIPVAGGTPVAIFEDGVQKGISWPTADTIVFAHATGILRIPANGGAAETLVAANQTDSLDSPQILPGGEQVLFSETGANSRIVVQSIGSDDRQTVWEGGADPRYLTTGHLVFVQGNTLFAIPFDPAARAVTGGPVPMVEGVQRSSDGFTDTGNYAVSDTGTLVSVPGSGDIGGFRDRRTTPVWVDRQGNETAIPVAPNDYTFARVSPDGSKIALVVGDGLTGEAPPPDIWVFDVASEGLSQLTFDPGNDDYPTWTRDGRILFRSWRDAAQDESGVGIYSISAEGGQAELVAASPEYAYPLPWSLSPDGETVALTRSIAGLGDIDIAALDLADGEFRPLLAGSRIENEPLIAPNGGWIAYQEADSVNGPWEISVRPFPDVARQRYPMGPGMHPVFSSDGTELFFDGQGIAAAPVSYEPSFRIGAPRRLFSKPYWYGTNNPNGFGGRAWDVDPTGDRFLMIRMPDAPGSNSEDEPATPQIDVVLNWTEELLARVPVD